MMKWSEGEIMSEFKGYKPNARYWSTGKDGAFASVTLDDNPADKSHPFIAQAELLTAQQTLPFLLRRRFSCFERAEAWAIDKANRLRNYASISQ